jgi:hypothetical protein
MVVSRISKEELQQRLDSPDGARRPTIVDARLRYPYEHSSVTLPGAIRVTPDAVVTTAIAKGLDVVVYDSDPNEITASRVASTMTTAGFHVQVLTGGLPEWIGANLPVDTKPGVIVPVPVPKA